MWAPVSLRILDSLTVASRSPDATSARRLEPGCRLRGRWAGGAALAAALAAGARGRRRRGCRCRRAPALSMWSSTSSRVIRPPGPVPVIADGSGRARSPAGARPATAACPWSPARLRRCGVAVDGSWRRRLLRGGLLVAGPALGGRRLRSAAGSGPGPPRPGPPPPPAARRVPPPAGASSPAAAPSPTTVMTVPTSTVSPSWTRISVSAPATGEGTSVSTLSVDTSNSASSAATVSPTCLNHCA